MRLQLSLPADHTSFIWPSILALKLSFVRTVSLTDLQWEANMDPQSTSRRLDQDHVQRVAVGDPDPTSDPGMANESRKCQFEWHEEISQTMTLHWCCTRQLGHQGQHIAGTGQCVAAVRDP